MKKTKVRSYESKIENDLLSGIYISEDPEVFKAVAAAINRRKKDTVLNIRVNSQDLESIKHKARKLGLKYQTFISEVLHKVAL